MAPITFNEDDITSFISNFNEENRLRTTYSSFGHVYKGSIVLNILAMCYTMLYMLKWMRKGKHRIKMILLVLFQTLMKKID